MDATTFLIFSTKYQLPNEILCNVQSFLGGICRCKISVNTCHVANHKCVCKKTEEYYCKSKKHYCVCPNGRCKSMFHKSEYGRLESFDSVIFGTCLCIIGRKCKAGKHKCACLTPNIKCKSYEHECTCSIDYDNCKAKADNHNCTCSANDVTACRSRKHNCICIYETDLLCRAGFNCMRIRRGRAGWRY